jgi:hypothetical protein
MDLCVAFVLFDPYLRRRVAFKNGLFVRITAFRTGLQDSGQGRQALGKRREQPEAARP